MEIARYHLNQSDLTLKPMGFGHVLFPVRLLAFTLSSHWLLVVFFFALTGCCDIFELGFSIQPKCTLSPNNKSRAN